MRRIVAGLGLAGPQPEARFCLRGPEGYKDKEHEPKLGFLHVWRQEKPRGQNAPLDATSSFNSHERPPGSLPTAQQRCRSALPSPVLDSCFQFLEVLRDMTHLFSVLVLLLKIYATKSCSGISLKTQELYALVFLTRYLDLLTVFVSIYNSVMKVVFISSSIAIVWCMRAHPLVLWAFSIYLEAVAILPQLVLLQRSRNVDNLTGQYVFFLGSSCGFYCVVPSPIRLHVILFVDLNTSVGVDSIAQEVLEWETRQSKYEISDFQTQISAVHEKIDEKFAIMEEMMKKSLEGQTKKASSEVKPSAAKGVGKALIREGERKDKRWR
ncbi:hypothetical protein M5K25_021529 [Dendrobium thyrsiflorum]|uniref:ER lumen protein-retaining receptor n=1 Tax=Dendrobium thyrsiflorum TaxID=117978 RepID=A0ABD0UJN1_DENTH